LQRASARQDLHYRAWKCARQWLLRRLLRSLGLQCRRLQHPACLKWQPHPPVRRLIPLWNQWPLRLRHHHRPVASSCRKPVRARYIQLRRRLRSLRLLLQVPVLPLLPEVPFSVDGRSSIEAAQVVARRREGPVTVPGQGRMDPEALAAPCIPHGLSPAELPVQAEGLVLALRVQALALVPALAPRALE
jgi:hypothetical protein